MIQTLLQLLPLPVNVWQMLWRSSKVFPVEVAEVQLFWLHIPACTSATTATLVKQNTPSIKKPPPIKYNAQSTAGD